MRAPASPLQPTEGTPGDGSPGDPTEPRRWTPIVLPGWVPPRELSPNARVHHMVRYRIGKQVKQDMQVTVLRHWWQGGALQQQPDGLRRRLTITVRRPRLMDEDNNAATGIKHIVDGVVAGGAALDDAPRYLEIVVRQEQGRAQTILELEEIVDG